eukprot:CAMPEP_0182588150 /NCGR_PEP_ID=MMETSP1324-20130603/66555_1 /TAXON_ID=236786 /ORGANISM="Florenciella sp., Strain RCC1587" /LENGTH=73 /DNA_ID=CAMNT_0024805195 /DNA_START=76 /DNA_END=297 /DNA_ORIENTATION=-
MPMARRKTPLPLRPLGLASPEGSNTQRARVHADHKRLPTASSLSECKKRAIRYRRSARDVARPSLAAACIARL